MSPLKTEKEDDEAVQVKKRGKAAEEKADDLDALKPSVKTNMFEVSHRKGAAVETGTQRSSLTQTQRAQKEEDEDLFNMLMMNDGKAPDDGVRMTLGRPSTSLTHQTAQPMGSKKRIESAYDEKETGTNYNTVERVVAKSSLSKEEKTSK